MRMSFRRLVVIGVAATLIGLEGGSALRAAEKVDKSDFMGPVKALAASLETGSTAGLASVYTDDATIVDEVPPYFFTGGFAAATARYASFVKMLKENKATNLHAVLGKPVSVERSGNRAYVVVPAKFTVQMGKKPAIETGTWTFVLVKNAGRWQIQAEAWGRRTQTM